MIEIAGRDDEGAARTCLVEPGVSDGDVATRFGLERTERGGCRPVRPERPDPVAGAAVDRSARVAAAAGAGVVEVAAQHRLARVGWVVGFHVPERVVSSE